MAWFRQVAAAKTPGYAELQRSRSHRKHFPETSYDDFGVLMVISLSVGVITPPFGNVIYVLVGITNQPFESIVRAILPFLIPIICVILFLVVFPNMVTYLPNLIL